ncbi:hypothetical protein [uncultured Marivirga sp.]|uniref:hypothetical protein n=1 Tax=uncultured Marivirga sp. TaxID=1123707 RepID=UPI0030ED020C|tara:strand:- start:18188 stop:18829 length:642 start_codon:yes stop_codon:yes gene_type:complete
MIAVMMMMKGNVRLNVKRVVINVAKMILDNMKKTLTNLACIMILAGVCFFGTTHKIVAQKSPFDETLKVFETSLMVFFESKLFLEIHTSTASGKTALYAELQLVKMKAEFIRTDLTKGDLYSTLKSSKNSAIISLTYGLLVFDQLDFKFADYFLNKMTNREMLDQKEKSCILATLKEHKVDEKRIGDFSKTDRSKDLQLYFSKLLGFFTGCNS